MAILFAPVLWSTKVAINLVAINGGKLIEVAGDLSSDIPSESLERPTIPALAIVSPSAVLVSYTDILIVNASLFIIVIVLPLTSSVNSGNIIDGTIEKS